jgi:hypothetical protein
MLDATDGSVLFLLPPFLLVAHLLVQNLVADGLEALSFVIDEVDLVAEERGVEHAEAHVTVRGDVRAGVDEVRELEGRLLPVVRQAHLSLAQEHRTLEVVQAVDDSDAVVDRREKSNSKGSTQ